MLSPNYDEEIPEMTAEVARAAFPKGNAVMKIRDELGPVFSDDEFAGLYPKMGQPAESPGRLSLVTILQFMENLTDLEAADAVRGRLDWKYLLGLELTDPGFHYSVLSEFRQRLLEHGAEEILLNRILEQCEAASLIGSLFCSSGSKSRAAWVFLHIPQNSILASNLAGQMGWGASQILHKYIHINRWSRI